MKEPDANPKRLVTKPAGRQSQEDDLRIATSGLDWLDQRGVHDGPSPGVAGPPWGSVGGGRVEPGEQRRSTRQSARWQLGAQPQVSEDLLCPPVQADTDGLKEYALVSGSRIPSAPLEGP